MQTPNIPHEEISKRVKHALKAKKLTLIECCNSYNSLYYQDISDGKMSKLNKDFLSRVNRNEFKIFNRRLSQLCKFLEVDLSNDESQKNSQLTLLHHEFLKFKELLRNDKKLKSQFSSIESFLDNIINFDTKKTGEKNEVY